MKTPDRIAAELREEGILLPRRRADNSIVWVKPTGAIIHAILTNPAYAGQLVIGKNRKVPGRDGKMRIRRTTRAEQQWKQMKGDAYVTLEQFEYVQAQIAARRHPRVNSWGNGPALCVRLIQHLPCAGQRRMPVMYTGGERHGHKCYSYICAPKDKESCAMFGGGGFDRHIEKIIFDLVRCPSMNSLKRAFDAENERRRSTKCLLEADVARAKEMQEEKRKHFEDATEPETRRVYDQEHAAAIRAMEAAERRLAAAETPKLLNTSPRFLADVAAHFRDFPRIWRKASTRIRRDILQQLIERIDVVNSLESIRQGDDLQLRIIRRVGEPLETLIVRHATRRKRAEALARQGLANRQIAAKMKEEGFVDQYGTPITKCSVQCLLRHSPIRAEMQAKNEQEIIRLWYQALTPSEIVAQLTEGGFLRTDGEPWRTGAVLAIAGRLKLPKRADVHLEFVRGSVEELKAQGLTAAAAAKVLQARGLKTFDRIPWNEVIVTHIHRVLRRRGISRFPPRPPRRRVPPQPARNEQ